VWQGRDDDGGTVAQQATSNKQQTMFRLLADTSKDSIEKDAKLCMSETKPFSQKLRPLDDSLTMI
jgi:hypothetical protein